MSTAKKRPTGKAEFLINERHPLFLALEGEEVEAIKALEKGAATPDQQKLALRTIIHKIANIGAPSINSDPAFMNINEGKRLVGAQIVYLLTNPYDKLIKEN